VFVPQAQAAYIPEVVFRLAEALEEADGINGAAGSFLICDSSRLQSSFAMVER